MLIRNALSGMRLLTGGGGGVTPADTPDAPVLSNLSSGWATGDNPPDWNTAFDGEYYNGDEGDAGFGQGDQLRLRWRLGGSGAFTTEAWVPYWIPYDPEQPSVILDGFQGVYAFLTDGTLDAGGLFEVYVDAIADFGLPTESGISSSNLWSDTLGPVAAEADIVYLGGRVLPFGFGSDPYSTDPLTVQNGDKILIALYMRNNGSTSFGLSAVDSGANPITLNYLGESAASGIERLQLYYADTVAIGSIVATVNPDASAQEGVVFVCAVRGAPAGAPTASAFAKPTVAGEGTHDVDLGVALPVDGRVLVAHGSYGTHTYTGATKIADLYMPISDGRASLAVQSVAGNVLVDGAPSGPQFGPISLGVTSWSKA